MAKYDISKYPLPGKDTIWECPCGLRGSYFQITGHRKGVKVNPYRHPRCVGEMRQVFPSAESTGQEERILPQEKPQEVAVSSPVSDEPKGKEGPKGPEEVAPVVTNWMEYEAVIPGNEDPDDPEVIARRLNEQLRLGLEGGGEGFETTGGGVVGTLPPGEWSVEPPDRAAQSSTDRIGVYLPVVIRTYYDIMRSKGWKQGDGSLSAFITDCLVNHFNNCWGFALVVVKREEINA